MSEADSIDIAYRVEAIERFDRGPIIAVAAVALEIAGVELRINGVTMRRGEGGSAAVLTPNTRHPRTGAWMPAVELPDAVWCALAIEIGAEVTGRPVRPGAPVPGTQAKEEPAPAIRVA